MLGRNRNSFPNVMESPSFAVMSFAYPQVSLSDRDEVGRALVGRDDEETIVFVTCLRVLVATTREIGALRHIVDERIPGTIEGATVHNGADAVAHLFSVVSGLQSPIRGEGEVLTQFRSQVLTRDLAPHLRIMTERAVGVARDLQRSVEAPRGSLAHVAVDLLSDEDHMAVVGGGQMARTIIDLATARNPGIKMTLAARRPDETDDIAGVDVVGMDRLSDLLATASVVVSATSAGGRLLEPDTLLHVLNRRSKPLLLIDLAMPPDFEPPADGNLRYVSVDDLADRVAALSGDDGLDDTVRQLAEDTWRGYIHSREVGAVIARLFTEVDDLVDETVSRFQGRLRDHDDTTILREAVRSAVRKLAATPVQNIHASSTPSHTAADVARIFGFEETDSGEGEAAR